MLFKFSKICLNPDGSENEKTDVKKFIKGITVRKLKNYR